MASAGRSKSIHNLPPMESGGVEARQGLELQDHVAACFCIDLLVNPSLLQVWCETQDDITLIWQANGGERVEFVQVKGNQPDQLWSISLLCEREVNRKVKKPGTSILERSLIYDRCEEPCCFRMITSRPVKSELKILTYGSDSHHRQSETDAWAELESRLVVAVGDFRSENGHCCEFWAASTTWQEVHSVDSVRDKNLLALSRAVISTGAILFLDQIEELYSDILAKVRRAAATRHADGPSEKKIIKDDFVAWVRDRVASLEHPVAPGRGKVLADKMRQAGIAEDVIASAVKQRVHYRIDVLTPQYRERHYKHAIDGAVTSTLHHLRSSLDAGQISDSGVAFHALCLDKLRELQQTFDATPKPELAFLFGYMYNVTDRCGHRFRRPAG